MIKKTKQGYKAYNNQGKTIGIYKTPEQAKHGTEVSKEVYKALEKKNGKFNNK